MKHIILLSLGLVISCLSFGQIPTTDLIKEYYLTNGNIQNNVSPGTNDLTPTGSARTIIPDPIAQANNALSLNGDQFAAGTRGATPGVGNGNLSVSFWIKTSTNSSTAQILFEQEGGSGFGNYGWFVELVDGKVRIRERALLNGSVVSGEVSAETAVISDNNWHHIVCTIEKVQFWSSGWAYGPRAAIYLDNVWQASQQTGGASNINLIYVQPIAEQVYLSTGASNYVESIDNIRVYNRTINTTEIQQLYNEYAASLTRLYVDKDATGNNLGNSWADAFTDLQTALTAATTQEIWVAEGIYIPHATDRTVSFDVPANISIYGGFDGTETTLAQRDWLNHKSILSGDLLANDGGAWGYTEPNRAENSYHVMTISGSNVRLDGLTISDGQANGGTWDYYAGGVYMNSTSNSITIENCTFQDNVARAGGAMFGLFPAGTSTLNVINTTFRHNLANTGAGFYTYPGGAGTFDVNVTSCLFSENSATDLGAILGNAGSAYVVYGHAGSNTINLVSANNTYVKNESSGTNAGINASNRCVVGICRNSSILNAQLHNEIYWGNTQLGGGTAVATGVPFTSPPASLTVANSIDQNSFANIPAGNQTNTSNSDPLFANYSVGNYNLTCSSPAVDAGNAAGLTLPSIDIENGNRIETTLDMGAFEFLNPHSAITAITQPATVYLDAVGNGSITPADVDNNSGTACGLAFTLSLDNSTFNCSNLGANTVTLTATETVSTLSDAAPATVTVLDTISPTVIANATINVQLNAAGTATITVNDIDNGSSDNCSGLNLSLDQTTFDCNDLGSNTVTLTGQDASGNTKTATTNVIVQDLIAPVAVAQNITVQLDPLTTQATITPAMVDNGTSDNCSFNLSLSTTTFNCSDIGTNTVTLTATDPAGNSHGVQATVTVNSFINDETVSASPTSICSAGNSATVSIPGSVSGVDYYLRDDATNSVIAGPIAGTGSNLDFNTGALSSTTTFNVYAEPSIPAYAMSLDGSNDLLSLGTGGRGITTQMTISAWVKPNATGGTQFIAGKYNGITGFLFYINAAGNVVIDGRDNTGVYKSSGASTTNVIDGTWHYVTGTINISTGVWAIMVDGIMENFANHATGSTLANSSTLYFGNTSNPVAGAYYSGSIDQISIWNSALNATQVASTMTTCLTGSEANLFGLYHMDENTGFTTADDSPTAYTATLLNATTPWVTGTPNICSAGSVACATEMTQLVTINVGDISAPIPDVATLSDLSDQCQITSLTPPTSTDNCAGAVTGTHNASLPITANTTITWTYDDGNGNTSTQTQNVVINDNTAPVADQGTLSDVTSQCSVTSLTAPTATDNCAGSIIGTHSASLPITSSSTVTWTYDDGNGNTATQTQNVVINDNTAPVADQGTLTDLTAQCSITSVTAPTATDNCTGVITGTSSFSLPITSSMTITWTYDDGNGNTSTQTQNVIINDNTAPVADIGSLAPIVSQCQVTSLTAPTATDNCVGSITGAHNASFPITSSTTVTWTYDDGNGNTSTQTQTVTVNDVTAPVADLGSLSTINAQCSVTSLTPPTATDNCVGTITGTHNASLPITATTTVIWTYDDGNGNSSTQTQNVVIQDVTAPVPDVATLSDITGQCSITSLTAPTATDNCAGTLNATHNASLPITSNTTVTWTYDDGNGNTSTQTQNVVLNDITPPVADAATLSDVTGQCSVTSLTPPTATDNCAGAITGTTNATLPITANTTVTWTYDDGNGNTSTQTQNVVLNDITAPVADVAILSDVTGQCSVTALTPPTATDNCMGAITGTTTASLPITSSITITWTYDDGNGNTSTQTQAVVINDNTLPVADQTTLADLTNACQITSLTPPTATDNCAGSITGTTATSLPITTSTTITWTYDDGNGNIATQTQNVIINDNVAPVPDLATLPDVLGACEVTTLTPPTATDNCQGTIAGMHNVALPLNNSTLVTWTYTDGNGNVTTQTQQVTITDNTPPVPNVTNLPDVNAICEVTTLNIPIATDDCNNNQIAGTHTTPMPITSTTTVTWTFTDSNGNTATQTQEVIISPVDDGTTVNGTTITANQAGADSYEWVDCGNGFTPIPGETNQSFTPSVNGNYAVRVTIGNCMVISACEAINTVGINELTTVGLDIYPNPASTQLTIEADFEISGLRLFDSKGRIVKVGNGPVVDVRDLESGVYYIEISSQGSTFQRRFVKQ